MERCVDAITTVTALWEYLSWRAFDINRSIEDARTSGVKVFATTVTIYLNLWSACQRPAQRSFPTLGRCLAVFVARRLGCRLNLLSSWERATTNHLAQKQLTSNLSSERLLSKRYNIFISSSQILYVCDPRTTSLHVIIISERSGRLYGVRDLL